MAKTNDIPLTQLDTIDTYNRLHALETLHPLAAVVDVRDFATHPPYPLRLHYGFYALWLKQGAQCTLRYGRNRYDYQEGTVVCFAPGQVVEVEKAVEGQNSSIGLLFHADLLHGTSLARHIGNYHFFDYASTEALHLSAREQQLFDDTLQSIRPEMEMPIDKHSQAILVDRIKLLLDYCQRFYDRQFITRHALNSGVLANFEQQLRAYFDSGEARRKGLPTVGYFAELACLSPHYFGDLIKNETGQTAQQYIQQHLLQRSKQLILDESLSLQQASEALGFQYPQHFTRFFKRNVGMSPSEFRRMPTA